MARLRTEPEEVTPETTARRRREIHARWLLVLRLRMEGREWEDVAERTQYTIQAAQGAYRRALTLLDLPVSDPKEGRREEQRRRIRAILREFHPRATAQPPTKYPDDPETIEWKRGSQEAARVVLAAEERLAKLDGLDEPQAIQPLGEMSHEEWLEQAWKRRDERKAGA
jgi:hypothetical protein